MIIYSNSLPKFEQIKAVMYTPKETIRGGVFCIAPETVTERRKSLVNMYDILGGTTALLYAELIAEAMDTSGNIKFRTVQERCATLNITTDRYNYFIMVLRKFNLLATARSGTRIFVGSMRHTGLEVLNSINPLLENTDDY